MMETWGGGPAGRWRHGVRRLDDSWQDEGAGRRASLAGPPRAAATVRRALLSWRGVRAAWMPQLQRQAARSSTFSGAVRARFACHVLQLSDERDAAIVPIGNLVPDSVPVDDDEVGWWACREPFGRPGQAGAAPSAPGVAPCCITLLPCGRWHARPGQAQPAPLPARSALHPCMPAATALPTAAAAPAASLHAPGRVTKPQLNGSTIVARAQPLRAA